MYTFFAHHSAVHDESNRAVFVTAAALIVIVAVTAILVWKGNKK